MSDNSAPVPEQQVGEKKKRASRSVTLKLNLNFFYVAIAIVVLVVVFFLGRASSDTDSKSTAKDSPLSASSRSQNRWTSVGNVEEVSDAKIKVKDSRDQVKEASITKDTKIVDRKGTNLKASDIKKAQRVIISGEKDGEKLIATRIRIQQ